MVIRQKSKSDVWISLLGSYYMKDYEIDIIDQDIQAQKWIQLRKTIIIQKENDTYIYIYIIQ